MKKIIIYLIVGLAIYGAGYYFVLMFKKPQQQAQTVVREQKMIILTADGFSPATVTIKAGTTVTWTNNSGGEATVNSDPHPQHTDYPGLNLGRFSKGQTLSLIFTALGKYGYHNHLNPWQQGTVIVE